MRNDGGNAVRAARPEMVSFDVTSGCNLRCAHCYNDSGSGAGDMDEVALIDTARQIRSLRPFNVCLCGGEPTCCPALLSIIDELYGAVGHVCMVSNGWNITPENAAMLASHGVHAVQISLDGAYAWQHDTLRGVRGAFERAVSAIRSLIDAGIGQVSVAILPTRLNCRTLEAYTKLCIDLGVTLMRSMPFIPSGRGATVGSGLMLDDMAYLMFCRKLRDLQNRYSQVIDIQWTDPMSHIAEMRARTEKGIRNMDMEIRSNGDIAVSAYLPIIAGNCRKHTLIEYWDAGYDRVWETDIVRELTKNLLGVYDLGEFEPRPYAGKTIRFDILEDRHEISH